MTIQFPLNSTDPTCPVSSEIFYDNDGNIIDNSHNHDNRYYTKDDVDNKLELIYEESKPMKMLKAGSGLSYFEYTGLENKTIDLDFEQSQLSPTIGVSTKPSRSDHYHQNLLTGIGLKSATYNGSNNTIFSLDFSNNGSSTKPSRDDHKHALLTAGNGLISNIYDGSDGKIFALDFGDDSQPKYGTENTPARRNHYHNSLVAGNGLIYKKYNGNADCEFSVEYEGYDNDFGTKISIARSDHKHNSLYVNTTLYSNNAIVDVESSNKILNFYNSLRNSVKQITVQYSTLASKLETKRKIQLSGNVSGFAYFDGSNDITIPVDITSLPASDSNSNSIKEVIGLWLESTTSPYIKYEYDENNYKISYKVTAADKLIDNLKINFNADISGMVDFNGSEKILNSDLNISPSGFISIRNNIKDYFILNNKDIKIQEENDKLKFTIPNVYKSDKHILPSDPDLYSIGSDNNRFLNIHARYIYTDYLKAKLVDIDAIEYSNYTGGAKFRVEKKPELDPVEFNLKADTDFSFRGHKHLNSDIQPDIIRTPGKITTEIIPYHPKVEWTGDLDDTVILNAEYYPESMTFELYNKYSNKNYDFFWNIAFDENKDQNNDTIMALSETGNLWIKNNLSVNGNLEVKGTMFTINSEEVQITDNFIILNSGEKGSGVSRKEAGLIIKRGQLEDYCLKFDEISGNLMSGTISNLKNIPRIENNISNNSIICFDNKMLKNSGLLFSNNTINFVLNNDNLKVENHKLFFNNVEILNSDNVSSLYYSKTQINNFFDGETSGKKKINWSNINDKPQTYPAIVTSSLVSNSTTIAANALAVSTLNSNIALKSDIGHNHTTEDITNIGSASKLNIIISSANPPSDGSVDFDLWFKTMS